MIQDAYRAIRALHFKGHGWRPWENAMEEPAAIIPGMSMRKYVKSWVTHWDTLRFSHGGEEDEREAKTWYPASLEKEKTGTTNSGENGHSSHPAPTPQETSILNAEGKEILGSEISAEPVPSPLFIQ